MPAVNPDILAWARRTAGLEPAEAARKAGIGPAGGASPADRLIALERGKAAPTRAQLSRLAKAYRRPLVAFYLSSPPEPGDRGHDFRTTVAEAPREEQAWLDVVIREVQAKHSLIKAALEDEDEVSLADYVAASDPAEGKEVLTERLTSLLGFDRDAFRKRRTLMEAFEYARAQVEARGVFTLLIGDLGSHHTAISAETFRGYALADPIAPMIVVNAQDARSAWSFTLFHEFCHLMLGQSGVSGGFGSLKLEQLCNDVASQVLLDDSELGLLGTGTADLGGFASEISTFAKERNLSRTLVAYRLLRAGRISDDTWTALRVAFRREWDAQRENERSRAKMKDGGPDYYVVRRHRVGPALLETVNYLLRSGGVSVVKAAVILGVRPTNVARTLAGGRI